MSTSASEPQREPQLLRAAEDLADHVERYLRHGDRRWDLAAALERYRLESKRDD